MMNSFILQAVEVSAQATFNEADLWHILLVSMIGMIAFSWAPITKDSSLIGAMKSFMINKKE